MTNIILCGGNGTRLWPISRTLMPKQFVKLFNGKSLFQLTVERNSKVCDSQFIVSNSEQYFLALDQMEELSEILNQVQNDMSKYLLEPVGRNTAPAIALACMALDKDEIVLVTPSDHLIKDETEYAKVLKISKGLANENNLVTFGIVPTFAETGFGYIEAINFNKASKAFDVKAFHEKPDFNTATSYLEAGNYYWNSGMFCFKAGIFLEELQKYSPEIYKSSLKAFQQARHSELDSESDITRIKHDDMLKIPEDSIDYAVIEKSNIVKVVPSNINWSDVGSFDALAEELPNDKNNNLIISDRKVETIDIKDCIIVDTGDALLVSKKGSSQKVKEIVTRLKKEKSQLPNIHLTGYRPWGTYTVLEDSDGYKIKRIEVKPGKRFSLQKHKYRNEHWVVVSGCTTVIINDKTFTLKQNESTYIKAGDIHRLSNDTDELLVIIEAQVGSYPGEDDYKR
ncbi:MAG: mannose-1-phosphate guanylyltransferase/mannose-6-phosphate isomerase [Sulfurimonas sp.]|nr:mannose-1-phosphate guanylyltransferase/mannose-6-phosphate isomerase [Sulfurimonas sp.]